MDGVYFLLSIIAVGLVMWWTIKNDRAGPGDETHGLFAMRDATSQPEPKDRRASRYNESAESSTHGPVRR